MNDAIGDRMKSQYENRTRFMLPRRTYTIIRLDGKAFHTYTRNLTKPFDLGLMQDMDQAVVNIMGEIQGAQFAYIQSDEISILLTDFATDGTCAWFDGNVQKICSVSASLMTAEFNRLRWDRIHIHTPSDSLALFDARVFTIPDPTEVYNYFVWRNKDAAKNSISMVAYSLYSPKELHGKNSDQKQEMLFEKGINWSEYPMDLKNGRLIVNQEYTVNGAARTKWVAMAAWAFTKAPEAIKNLIPKYP
jgi:tRNA(His) guanylyltransferase